MKKLLLLVLLCFMGISLTGCFGDNKDVVSNDLVKEVKEEILSVLINQTNMPYYESLAEAEAANDDYFDYATGKYIMEPVIDQFANSLVKAELTNTQVQLILDNARALLPQPEVTTEDEDVIMAMYIELITTILVDIQLTSDQMVNIVYYTVKDLDDTVLASVDTITEKDANKVDHDELISDLMEYYITPYAIIFNVDAKVLENALVAGQFVIGDFLDYTYGFAANVEDLIGSDLSAADVKTVLKAQLTSFKNTFGKNTKADVVKALNAIEFLVEKFADLIAPENTFVPMEDDMKNMIAEVYVAGVKTYTDCMTIVLSSKYDSLLTIMIEGSETANPDLTMCQTGVLLADLYLVVIADSNNALLNALFMDDETVAIVKSQKDLATTIKGYGIKAEYSEEEMTKIAEFMDFLMAFVPAPEEPDFTA